MTWIDIFNLSASKALIKTAHGWKIAQYHLSFPIPNAIAITQQIITAPNELTHGVTRVEAGQCLKFKSALAI
ncbi:hypothetical protein TUM4445_22440 [Shewanella sp. MBTL60-112-B2]|nr:MULTISPECIES: nuclear transport factor 2 family protein [unclassified Shewanella]GIU09649.1 hypothetical protein TUM4444_12620 [Shewanella sp. MBTL60-112-B1]GIU34139.1 hypothetical protein TUM4445_22440 [Shewanella sp. MBTL60-112-B2]